MSTDSNEDILLDENRNLREQLVSANVKINTLAMEVSSLKGTLEMAIDSLRRYKDKEREENKPT